MHNVAMSLGGGGIFVCLLLLLMMCFLLVANSKRASSPKTRAIKVLLRAATFPFRPLCRCLNPLPSLYLIPPSTSDHLPSSPRFDFWFESHLKKKRRWSFKTWYLWFKHNPKCSKKKDNMRDYVSC